MAATRPDSSTPFAGYLTKAKTAFRGQNGTGYVYFLITDLKLVK